MANSLLEHTITLPTDFIPEGDYSSHRPLLYLAIKSFAYPIVLEFGCGDGSTPAIYKLCKESGFLFFSIETDKEWAKKFDGITRSVANYDTVELGTHIDILFIDSKPGEQRKELIKMNAKRANIIIVHDTQPSAEYVYGLSEVLDSLKYRCDLIVDEQPQTTAVSNFLDVTKWKGIKFSDQNYQII